MARPCEEDADILPKALELYTLAIGLNGSNPIHYFNRGNVHLNRKHFPEAFDDFNDALARDDTNPKFWHAKGLTYETAADTIDDPDEKLIQIHNALEMFGQAQERSDSFYSAVFHQALMYRRVQRFQDALR